MHLYVSLQKVCFPPFICVSAKVEISGTFYLPTKVIFFGTFYMLIYERWYFFLKKVYIKRNFVHVTSTERNSVDAVSYFWFGALVVFRGSMLIQTHLFNMLFVLRMKTWKQCHKISLFVKLQENFFFFFTHLLQPAS